MPTGQDGHLFQGVEVEVRKDAKLPLNTVFTPGLIVFLEYRDIGHRQFIATEHADHAATGVTRYSG